MSERGALMFEALAVVGIISLTVPIAMRQTARQQKRMEDAAVENQTRRIEQALKDYLNFSAPLKTAELSRQGIVRTTFAVADKELKPFLPASYFDNGKIRPNKSIESYTLSGEASCTAAADLLRRPCPPAALTANCRCVKYAFFGTVKPVRSR